MTLSGLSIARSLLTDPAGNLTGRCTGQALIAFDDGSDDVLFAICDLQAPSHFIYVIVERHSIVKLPLGSVVAFVDRSKLCFLQFQVAL